MGLLRFFLAVSVILGHAGPICGVNLVGGVVAVQIFFMISGFYMALVFEEKYATLPIRTFYLARFLRLFPSYWIILTILLIAAFLCLLYTGRSTILMPFFEYANAFPFQQAALFLFVNIGIFFQDVMMFLGFDEGVSKLVFTKDFNLSSPPVYRFLVIPQAWSLSLELLFYLMVPFLLRLRNTFLIGIVIGTFALRFGAFFLLNLKNDPWTYRFFPFELGLFLLGSLAYRYRGKLNFRNSFLRRGVLLSFLLMLCICSYFAKTGGAIYYFSGYLTYGVGIISIPLLFSLTKNVKWDSYLGEFSYPLYLVHFGIIQLLSDLQLAHSHLSVMALLFSLLLTLILIHLFIRPLENFRLKTISLSRR
jgi:peptidoglycan/LPS O-acetylase OafA/YrhL